MLVSRSWKFFRIARSKSVHIVYYDGCCQIACRQWHASLYIHTVSESICLILRPLEYRFQYSFILAASASSTILWFCGTASYSGLCPPPEFSFSAGFLPLLIVGLFPSILSGITVTRLRHCSSHCCYQTVLGSPMMSVAVSSSPLLRTVFMALKPSLTVWVPAGAHPGELIIALAAASPWAAFFQGLAEEGKEHRYLARTWLKEQT